METNPYSSPREVATGDAPLPHKKEPSGRRVVLIGIGVGALLGAVAGVAAALAILGVLSGYATPDRILELSRNWSLIASFCLLVALSITVGAVTGAIGFGFVAAARRIRRRWRQ